jgi:hypothetical protein
LSRAHSWGTTAAERERPLPCDGYLESASEVYDRAIDVDAPPPVVFRWLCQLRVAPYSYDLLDNFGRRSPRELTPGLEALEVGQRFMTIFDLVEFEHDRHVTLRVERLKAVFGDSAVTYLVEPRGGAARLQLRIRLRRGRGPLMPWLELFMSRKQLLTLKKLAERSGHVPQKAV